MFNEKYLADLIEARTEESLHLDYKASAALDKNNINRTKESISKDVSAFANADGGILIYGIKEDAVNKHLPLGIDPIERGNISKEWIEQIIQTSIQPHIEGITIHPIEIQGDKHKVVYVINVPKSTTAHQANDHRYYRRHNFNNLPMYDYEIRDVFNRVKHPVVDISFSVNAEHYNDGHVYYLKVYAKNTGAILANYINCYITLPSKCIENDFDPYGNETQRFLGDNTTKDLLDVVHTHGLSPSYKYGPSRYIPLLPQTEKRLDFVEIQLRQSYIKDDAAIDWIVYADNAGAINGSIKLQDISVNYY